MSDKPLTPAQCRLILVVYLIAAAIGFIALEYLK